MIVQRRWHWFATVLTVGALTACGGPEAEEPAAELTRAQKDSIVAGMPIPGASAVGGAMRARDAANARTEAHDTIR